MPTTILAGGTGYSEPTGTWGSSGSLRYTNTAGSTATFTFGSVTPLTPGAPHFLALSWSSDPNRVTNTAWSVAGTAGSPSGTIDQQADPVGFSSGGNTYQYFSPTFTP